MAIVAERLRVEVEADTDQAEKGLRDLGDEGSKIPTWAKAAGAALAAAFAVDKIVDGVKAAIGAASDLQQSVGGVEAVFGANAATVNAWAAGSAKALGLSSNSYNEFATIVGSQLKNMGMPMEQVTGQTNDLITKGADLAATFGGSTSDAVSALSSLLRGETDPIERYGVSIKQADIAARLAAQGQSNLTGEALKSATAQATLALLTEQTAAAQGKFASEGDTFAGVQQRMAAGWTNIVATIGGAFLPVATQALGWVSDAMDWFGARLPAAMATLSDVFSTLVLAFSAGFAALREGDVTSDGLVGAFETVGDALHTLWTAAGPIFTGLLDTAKAVAAAFMGGLGPAVEGLGGSFGPLLSMLPQLLTMFSPLHLILEALTPVLPQLAGAVGSLVGSLASTLLPVLTTLLPVLSQVAGMLTGALSKAFASLLPVVVQIVPVIGQLVSAVVGALLPVLSAILPVIAQVASILIGALGTALQALIPIVLSLLPVVTSLVGILGGVLLTVVQALSPILVMLAGVIAELLPALMPVVGAVLEVVGALLPLVEVAGDLIGAILPPLVDLLMALLEPILALIGPLLDALVPVLTMVADLLTSFLIPLVGGLALILGTLLTALMPVISAILGGLVTALTTLIKWVVQAVAAIVTFVGDAIAGFGRFASGASEKIGEVIGFFVSIPGKIMDAISGLWQMLYDAGANIIGGLADGIKSAVKKVTGAVGDVLGKARDLLPFSPAKTGPFSGKGWTLYSGRSITSALADGMVDNLRQVQSAGLAVATAAAMNIPGANIGATTGSTASLGAASASVGASPADALGVGSASTYAGPTSITVVDSDGALIGTMRTQAGKVATGQVTPLDEGKSTW